MKSYAISIFAVKSNTRNSTHVAMSLKASSEEEAIGKAYRYATEVHFPISDGWISHSVSIVEVLQ